MLIGYSVDWKLRKKSGGNGAFRNSNFRSNTWHMYGTHGNTGQEGNSAASNISSGSCDQIQVVSTSQASTSHEGNIAALAKGQAISEEECKQILNMLYKDISETKKINMTGITTCLMSHTTFPKD